MPSPSKSRWPTRRQILKSASGVALAFGSSPLFSLTGCDAAGEAPASTPHEQLARKVRQLKGNDNRSLVIFYPKGSLGNLKPVVKAFQHLTKVKIDLVEASLDEISAEMILSSRLGHGERAFDVAVPATFGLPDLVEAGAIEPLDALAASHEPPGLMDKAFYTVGDRYKGHLYGYQADGDVYTMFYNKAWMEDPEARGRYQDTVGKPLAIPKTWEELDGQMRFFHAPDKGRYGGSLFRTLNYIAWEFWVRLHAQGIYPMGDDMVPRVNTPQGLAALNALIEASRHQEPAAATQGLFDNFKSFGDGTKYCNIGWGGTQKYLHGPKSKLRGKLAFGPLPGGVLGGEPVAMPYFNWGWNYVVSSKSRVKELAYLFILFASMPKTSTMSVREPSGYFDPFREEHYKDPMIIETYGRDFLDVHKASLSSCIPDFYLRGQGQYLSAVKRAVHAANAGQLKPEMALEALASKWNKITDTLGRDKQREQWLFLKKAYPPRLQNVLS